jgi:hypothetical protein
LILARNPPPDFIVIKLWKFKSSIETKEGHVVVLQLMTTSSETIKNSFINLENKATTIKTALSWVGTNA